MSIKRTAIALVLGGGLALAPVGAAHAEGTLGVALSPPTAGPGTVVEIRTPDCGKDGVATVNGVTIHLTYEKRVDAAWGQYTLPSSIEAGDYTVTIKCDGKVGSATLTATTGSGAPAGGGATARTSLAPIIVGGGMAALGAVAVAIVMRGRRARTAKP